MSRAEESLPDQEAARDRWPLAPPSMVKAPSLDIGDVAEAERVLFEGSTG
ncbi:MAG: hypothetical protein AAGF58_00970 [Pseudomonadota bacterium]